MSQTDLLDLVIIGGAAVGCSAAVYAARRNLNFVVVTGDIGGEVAKSGEVENWPGTEHTTGFELSQTFYKHAKSYGVQFDEGFFVESITQDGNTHIVRAKNDADEVREYKTKTVIIGSGIHPRMLGIPGEAEFKNKGVTYCTVCDGPLYRGKTTTTIGAGSAALESALMMGGIAEKVYLITKYAESNGGGFPKGEKILVEKVKKMDNVNIIYNASTKEIAGEQMVSTVTYTDNESGEEKTIETNGVMVHIGMIPNSDFVTCADKNPQGEVEISLKCETSCAGVFAAGDVTNIPYKQIAIAAGQGVTAALSAIEYINKWDA